MSSKSAETKKLVESFSHDSEKHIESIYRQLLNKKFKFTPAHGVLQKRPGKDPRPIVISILADRIVRRSILDVIQEQDAVKPFYENDSSFGGIREKGVKQAIEAVLIAVRDGATYYLCSDIQNFFMNIPRPKVLATLHSVCTDPIFDKLLDDATRTELINIHQIKRKDLFPTYSIGVAQGCCLSPLLGNIILNGFDRQMNERGMRCIRYIDDFIILGKKPSHIYKAFVNAHKNLSDLGLRAYNPYQNSSKASVGKVQNGFDFLGCEIIPGLLRPSIKARQRLITRVEGILKESFSVMSCPTKTVEDRKSFIQSLMDVHNTVMGWGNQYSFCNDYQTLEHLDAKIHEIIQRYINGYAKRVKDMDPRDRRRIFGVHCLIDSKRKPLLPLDC